MTRAVLIGLGATGAHIAHQLHDIDEVVLVDVDVERASRIASKTPTARFAAATSSPDRRLVDGADIVVLALPAGDHAGWALVSLEAGAHVVSISDDVDDVEQLLALDGAARAMERTLIVGAGFAPGLTCLLVRHAADLLDEVLEIGVAKSGTGGPACARQHHRAMKLDASEWMDGAWTLRRGGSGRDLVWFPPPIGARDCYKAGLPSPLLLQRRFPDAERIAARVSATRRDRLTERLPMLRPPHADGGPGGVRVEVRGRRQGAFESIIYAVMGHPSTVAGTVAAVSANAVLDGAFGSGAFGLAEVAEPLDLLLALDDRGVRALTFEGSAWSG